MRERGKGGGRTTHWRRFFWEQGKRSFFYWEKRFFDRLEEKHKGIEEESNCNQGWPGMLLITLEILTHIRFLRVFVYEYLMYCWLMWTKRATSCFIDIGCSLMLSRICLWSFPLAWAHWKITRCGFILFWSRMFVLSFVPSILYHTCFCFSSYPSHGHQPFISVQLQGLRIQLWVSAKESNAPKFWNCYHNMGSREDCSRSLSVVYALIKSIYRIAKFEGSYED